MSPRYCTASSLDGFIATPEHSVDWLFQLGDIGETSYPDFMREVGALAMGSSTYERMLRNIVKPGSDGGVPWLYTQPTWTLKNSRFAPSRRCGYPLRRRRCPAGARADACQGPMDLGHCRRRLRTVVWASPRGARTRCARAIASVHRSLVPKSVLQQPVSRTRAASAKCTNSRAPQLVQVGHAAQNPDTPSAPRVSGVSCPVDFRFRAT